jgi:hypothetical protein
MRYKHTIANDKSKEAVTAKAPKLALVKKPVRAFAQADVAKAA